MSFVYAKVRQNPNITRQTYKKYRDLADYIIFLQENTYTNINLSFESTYFPIIKMKTISATSNHHPSPNPIAS